MDGALASAVTRVAGASAITFGARIFVSRDASREILRGSDFGRRLLAHELAHVRQYARDGFLPFLVGYIAAYVRGRRRGLSHFDAYADIPYEREAAQAES